MGKNSSQSARKQLANELHFTGEVCNNGYYIMDPIADPAASPQITPHPALLSEIGNLVNEAGGVSGLTQQFEQRGMGGIIQGWIGTGPNPAIEGQQVVDVIGRDRVAAIAGKVGLSEAQVVSGISTLLPVVINELTPNGNVPAHSPSTYQFAFDMLRSKLLGS